MFLVASAVESLGDVRHSGKCGPLNLIAKAEIPATHEGRIDIFYQLSGRFPGVDVFEPGNAHELSQGAMFDVQSSTFNVQGSRIKGVMRTGL